MQSVKFYLYITCEFIIIPNWLSYESMIELLCIKILTIEFFVLI